MLPIVLNSCVGCTESNGLLMPPTKNPVSLPSLDVSVHIHLTAHHRGQFQPIVTFQSNCFMQVSQSLGAILFKFKSDRMRIINMLKCQIVQFGDFKYHPKSDMETTGLAGFNNRVRGPIHMECEHTSICDTWVFLIGKLFENLPDMYRKLAQASIDLRWASYVLPGICMRLVIVALSLKSRSIQLQAELSFQKFYVLFSNLAAKHL